jgi:hypothetical protein
MLRLATLGGADKAIETRNAEWCANRPIRRSGRYSVHLRLGSAVAMDGKNMRGVVQGLVIIIVVSAAVIAGITVADLMGLLPSRLR